MVHSHVLASPVMRGHYPVEFRNRLAAGKAATRRMHLPFFAKFPHCPTTFAPLVEIAHHDSRAIAIAIADMRKDRLYLIPPAEARKVEMGGDDPDVLARNRQIYPRRAAWFQCRQIDRFGFQNIEIPADQYRIAMPPKATRPFAHFGGPPMRIVESGPAQYAGPVTKPQIGLLQRDNVGIHFAQDRNYPVGIEAAISPDTLVNIIAGNRNLHALRNLIRCVAGNVAIRRPCGQTIDTGNAL